MTDSVTTFDVPNSPDEHEIFLSEPGNYRVVFSYPDTRAKIRGGWWLRDSETATVQVDVIHAAERTHSDVLLRGIASDAARLRIHGTIEVQENATSTQAFLTENVLLLSPKASAEAVPNLEIACNEVKCSHAATVSPIPEEHLFYLASRGLNPDEATELLAASFLRPTQRQSTDTPAPKSASRP